MSIGDCISAHQRVSEILTQLKSHFNQPVHRVKEEPPYFDSLLGKPLPESSIVRFFLEQLTALPSDCIFDWIAGYETTVHDVLREPGGNAVPVLQNYEWILSRWFDGVEAGRKTLDSVTTESRLQVPRTAALISKDLLLAYKRFNNLSTYLRCNVLIPTLLRTLHQVIRVLIWSNVMLKDEDRDHFVTCVISLLPFLKPRIDPSTIDPGLVEKNSEDHFQSLCIFPPRSDTSLAVLGKFFALEDIDWNIVAMNVFGVICDAETGISLRAAELVLENLATWFQSSSTDYIYETEDWTSDKISMNCAVVLRHLGVVRVAQAVNSRFFGNDGDQARETTTQCQVFLGKQILQQSKPLEEKEYKFDPTVIHILLNFIGLIDCKDKEYTSELVSGLIPCCMELLDSTNSKHAALGSSGLNKLLRVLEKKDASWRKSDKEILSKLEGALKVHKEGPTILAIGCSQLLILESSSDNLNEEAQVCKQWLVNLHQATHRSAGDTCWELLVGGVVPLLNHMAKCSDARGMEIGRLGLSVLLPMVAGEFGDVKTQAVATIALINLLIAAHPIMSHHGGKIICSVLASFSTRLDNNTDEVQLLRDISLHTAALCLIVTGPSAEKVIESVEMEKEKYQTSFLQVLSQVRILATNLAHE